MIIKPTEPLKYEDSKKEEGYFSNTLSTEIERVDVYLTADTNEGKFYTVIDQKLRTLKVVDQVNFYLRNYGGTINGLTDLLSAIHDTCAQEVNMILTAPSYSCGALLALAGTSLVMKPNTFLMFHNYSTGNSGKGGEAMISAKEHDKWIKHLMRSVAMPFLTEGEMQALEKDQDIYIHEYDKSVKSRIKRHFKGK
jgi:ATP-dependent protease ClpP protease subunit